MINECFQHCHGIGPKTEKILKSRGFITWEDCLQNPDKLPVRGNRRKIFLESLKKSKNALENNNLSYLIKEYPAREHWRILGPHYSEATYFDIETTGISWYDSHTTLICAYHKGKLYEFLYNENLDDFLQLVDESRLLVSFNGNSFDIPYLEKTFNIPQVNAPHIDLRWVAYHCGYSGGLKSIESELNVVRPDDVSDIDGFEAVNLYYRWQDGDENAKKYLTAYCNADVISTFLTTCEVLKKYGFHIKHVEPEQLFKMAMEPLGNK